MPLFTGSKFGFNGFGNLYGRSPSNPGKSAYDIKLKYPSSPDGFYYVRGQNGNPVLVLCDMTNDDGGWMLTHLCNNTGAAGSQAIHTQNAVGSITNYVTGTLTGNISANYKVSDADINYWMSNAVAGIDRPTGNSNLTNPIFRAGIGGSLVSVSQISSMPSDYFMTDSSLINGSFDSRGKNVGSFSNRGLNTYNQILAGSTPFNNSYLSGTYTGWGPTLFESHNLWGDQMIWGSTTSGFYLSGWRNTGACFYR